MANIVLKGNTSGSITITSPDVSGVNVLTLPVETGTILTTNTPLPEVSSVEFAGAGTSSGSITITAPDTDETNTLTFPETTGTFATENSLGMRNIIINGNMQIDQRNAGASITPTDTQYSIDRWTCRLSTASKYTAQQNAGAVTPPAGFINYLGATSTSAYSVGSSDYFMLRQLIEGSNITNLNWGTANAKTITLSFWTRSSLTGTFGGSVQNSNSDRSYPFTYTISVADTWEYKTITISGDTSGTWLTTNGVGIKLNFNLGNGSSFNGTAGAWAGANYHSTTGATSVVGTSGATLYITGVQLETGTVATPFENLQYGQQLSLCQRYFQKSWDEGNAVGSAVSENANSVQECWGSENVGIAGQSIALPVNMRTAPTLTVYDMALTTGKVSLLDAGATVTNNITPNLTNANMSRFMVRMYANNKSGIAFAYTLRAEL